MAINNPYVPGDPFSYDLKWIIKKLKEHGTTIQQILAELPDDSHIKEILQQMIDDGEITALALQSIGVYNVKDYGAKGDGIADDYTAIMDTYTAAEAAGGIMYFPAGTYLTNATLRFPLPVHVVMEGEIYSPIQAPIVYVGEPGAGHWCYYQNWRIRGISGVNTGSVGLVLENFTSSRIYIDMITYVETGVKFVGNDFGMQNNTFFLNEITDCKYGIVLDALNTGWCNENLFIGGRFSRTSRLQDVPTVGITITSSDGSYYNNNNVFIKPNLEAHYTGILFDYANYNHVYKPRMEGVPTSAVYNNQSSYNEVDTGYGNMAVTSMKNIQKRARFNWGFPDEGMKFEMLPSFSSSSAYNATAGTIKDYGAIQTTQQAFQFQSSYTKYTLPPIDAQATPVVAGQTPYIILTGPSYTGAIIDVKSDGRGVFWWKPIIVDDHGVDPDTDEPIHVTRGVFRMYKKDGSLITTPPEYFPGSSAASYTAGSTVFYRFGFGQYGYAFIIPEDCATIFAGVELASGQTEGFYTMAFGSNIPYAIRRHDLTLPSIPTSSNSPTGTIVTQTNASKLWIYNKGTDTWMPVPV